jgi:oxaloacetate decarboxylase (Na+ extruding) subunit gamma
MTEQMGSGIELMIVGMGIVFLFLAMLVIAINLMSMLIQRYFPDAPVPGRTPVTIGTDASTIAAIAAAVHQYRNQHK